MEMEFSRLERIVGTFIIGVSMLLMATLVIIGRGKDWFETYTSYYTVFDESYNLQENASVKLYKADIGRVKKITLEKNRVRVQLAILEKYATRIREDAIAVVESPTLIGSEYISIIPGSPESRLIPPRGEIKSREKKSIADIMNEFEVEKTAKMAVKAIQDIADAAQLLGDPTGPLLSALISFQKIGHDLEDITADLRAGKGPAGALLQSQDLLKQILYSVERLGNILDNVDTASARAPHTMALVEENLTTFREAGHSVKVSIDQAGLLFADIRAAAADLEVIMDNIKTGSYKVPRISTAFLDGVEEIREGVEQINRVVESMQKSILLRSNLPPEKWPLNTDAGARP